MDTSETHWTPPGPRLTVLGYQSRPISDLSAGAVSTPYGRINVCLCRLFW